MPDAKPNLTDSFKPFLEPPLNVGEVHAFKVGELHFEAFFTGDSGINTARDRFCVSCVACALVLHPNTTAPASRIRSHLRLVHGVEVSS